VILIAGLGNPGKEYENTKHNLGFRVIDDLCSQFNIGISPDKKLNVYSGRGKIENHFVLLVKPQSFMNNSGTAVSSLARYFKISAEKLIVICDDIDLPLGSIRIREKGSSGGHKGLESIIRELGYSNFCRIRIGIDRPSRKEDVVDYVLSGFNKSETELVKKSISKACSAIPTIICEGIKKAMSIYNREG
jgi:peptidyl-tRNA hydrolase, PTH1 family